MVNNLVVGEIIRCYDDYALVRSGENDYFRTPYIMMASYSMPTPV
jgi:hypothetical protein